MQTTVRVIATAEHQYAGRRIHPGEEYDSEPGVADRFRLLGWVRPAAAGQQYQTRDMTAAAKPRSRKFFAK